MGPSVGNHLRFELFNRVAGSQERITPASVVRRVAAKYGPTATCKEFADHAHWVVAEPGWQEVAV